MAVRTEPGRPLTAREREVAVLAAKALTDRQIARHLGISERTVHTHLRSAYVKTGAGGSRRGSRVRLAAWLQNRDGAPA